MIDEKGSKFHVEMLHNLKTLLPSKAENFTISRCFEYDNVIPPRADSSTSLERSLKVKLNMKMNTMN